MSVINNSALLNALDRLADAPLSATALRTALVHLSTSIKEGANETRLAADYVAKRLGVSRTAVQSGYKRLIDSSLITRISQGHKRISITRFEIIPSTCVPPPSGPDAGGGQGGKVEDGSQLPAPPKAAPTSETSSSYDAKRLADLMQSWPEAWREIYSRRLLLGESIERDADAARILNEMSISMSPQDWMIVQASFVLQREHVVSTRTAANTKPAVVPDSTSASNMPAAPDLAATQPPQDIEHARKTLERAVAEGRVCERVAGEIWWSITRGELSRISTARPIFVGLSLVRRGSWSRPRSLPATWQAPRFSAASDSHSMH